MSQPPSGPPPPYYSYPPVPPHPHAPGAYAYVPTPVMMPMPVYHPPPPAPPPEPTPPQPTPPQPTYVTNYIYQQPPPPPEPVGVVEGARAAINMGIDLLGSNIEKIYNQARRPPEIHIQTSIQPASPVVDWVPATPTSAPSYAHRAVVAGKEGWDSSPLWVIRAHHSGDLVPGKLAVKHRSAYIPHGGKEVPVHNFELLCAPAHAVHWLPASNGSVPVGAIVAGNTYNAEPLYIGRAKHMRSITPGKVHSSHGCMYMSFGGKEIPFKQYEVLCKIVG